MVGVWTCLGRACLDAMRRSCRRLCILGILGILGPGSLALLGFAGRGFAGRGFARPRMPALRAESARIGGPVKPLQPWRALQALDLRAGLVQEAKMPAEVASKYKIKAPAAR